MHLLICSHAFDQTSAEGICTRRLVRALLDAGCSVTLATSKAARPSIEHEKLRCIRVATWPRRPHKVYSLLARLLGEIQLPGPHYAWVRRIAALRLPDRPALVYGRALPFSSVVAARALARRVRVPLVTHFSDPVPSPWLEQGGYEFRRLVPGAEQVVREATAATFTTHQAMTYQQEVLSVDLEKKSFVLNHIAPPPAFLPRRPPGEERTYSYFGGFYGKRTASALLEGFALHLRSAPNSRFICAGTSPQAVLPDAERLGISAAVKVCRRVDDIRPLMAETDVLVSVDAASGPPVFLSTKLVEYLVVNRPVLLISPARSPGAALARRFQRTVIHVSREDPEAIADGLNRAGETQAEDPEYAERFVRMDEFSAHVVARRFLEEISERCIHSPQTDKSSLTHFHSTTP